VLAFSVIENGRSWLFSTKIRVMWPLIVDQRLIHLTPHMFPSVSSKKDSTDNSALARPKTLPHC
jgi:hypothetical protein